MIVNFSIPKDQLLYVPYRSGPGSGSPNIGFVDLKTQPERIDEIHELNGYPELKNVILSLNHPDCIFRTLRTDTAKNEHKLQDYKNCQFSHLTICFERPAGDDDARFYKELYPSFRQYATEFRLPDSVIVGFMLIPMELTLSNFRGWCLDVWLYGYGMSDREARNNWLSGLKVVHEYFILLNNELR